MIGNLLTSFLSDICFVSIDSQSCSVASLANTDRFGTEFAPYGAD